MSLRKSQWCEVLPERVPKRQQPIDMLPQTYSFMQGMRVILP